MFDAEAARTDLVSAFDRTWLEIGAPGTWWSGAERVAIAASTRAWWTGTTPPADLPDAAAPVIRQIAREAAATTEEWVIGACEDLGEFRYVELVGVVARVVAVDTFARVLGMALPPLPEPLPGDPTQDPPPANLRRNRTWVSMATPSPPSVLGAVPAASAAMNDLCDHLYMPPSDMGDADWQQRKLNRTQMELVAATVSHHNECFY